MPLSAISLAGSHICGQPWQLYASGSSMGGSLNLVCRGGASVLHVKVLLGQHNRFSSDDFTRHWNMELEFCPHRMDWVNRPCYCHCTGVQLPWQPTIMVAVTPTCRRNGNMINHKIHTLGLAMHAIYASGSCCGFPPSDFWCLRVYPLSDGLSLGVCQACSRNPWSSWWWGLISLLRVLPRWRKLNHANLKPRATVNAAKNIVANSVSVCCRHFYR